MKECSKCGEAKPLTAFYRAPNGHRADCKACGEENRRLRRLGLGRKKGGPVFDRYGQRKCGQCGLRKEPGEFYTDKQYGLDSTCKECRRAKRRREYWADPEMHRALTRSLYQRKADDRRAYGNQYRRDHLEDFARRESERRARRAGVHIEHVDRLVVLELDDGVCGICGDDIDPLDYEIDHIIPLARGGEHSYANCQVAHRRCNNTKRARLMDELPVAA